MQQTIDQIFANTCRDLVGTELGIELPITQGVMQKIVLDSIDQKAFNWFTSQIGPNNVLLFKMNVTTRVIFKTTFTVSLYIKLRENATVSEGFHPIADIYGLESGLGFGKRKVMKKLREVIAENLPAYLNFREDCFYIDWNNYFETYKLPLSTDYFSEFQFRTDYAESRSEEVAAKMNIIWLKTNMAI